MASRPKSKEIRKYILAHVGKHPQDISRFTAEHFHITRQAAYRHLKILIDEGQIEASGTTRSRTYVRKSLNAAHRLLLSDNKEEDRVWDEYVEPLMDGLPRNIYRICLYGFSEMFNNAIDHSGGQTAVIGIERRADSVQMTITDDGIGIFEKIKQAFNLEDHRHAILELSKGKLTTDRSRHTGEGIFFTSRMFDHFSIYSGRLYFTHNEMIGDWLLESVPELEIGTGITMEISTHSRRTPKQVFDRYSSEEDDYAFSKTHVPLSLSKYGSDELISRSQAKRVLSRSDRFKEVLLDFKGVDSIGQAFADEIFRVFAQSKPEIKLVWINANEEVEKMIRRAIAARD